MFAVDVTGLALLPDPFFDSGEEVSFYSPPPLAPERVRFLCCTPDLARQHRAV